jgi:peptidoglycan/LPS O-acetylase OafA/YrhL
MNTAKFSVLEPVRHHVDRRLRVRLRAFLIVWLILVVVIAIELFRHNLDIGLAVVGSSTGLLAGFILSRIYHLSWNQDTLKVVSRMDWISRVILAAYVLFMIGRNWIIGHWVEASDLMGFALCFTAGVMIGRVGGTRRGIRILLRALGVIDPEDPDSSQI